MFGKVFKFLFRWRLSVLAVVALVCITYGTFHKRPVYREVNAQRKATHLIEFIEKNDQTGEQKVIQLCTGTAVGPDALLTDEHCIFGANSTVTMDLSPRVYTVVAAIADGRDHVILHILDANFKNTVHIVSREAKLGEHVRMYGNGEGDFPSHALHGVVIRDDYEGDLSDVDTYVGTACYSFRVVPGDSGSAVYGDDNEIVGLVSLGRGFGEHPFDYATGYALNFTPEQIEMVSKGD